MEKKEISVVDQMVEHLNTRYTDQFSYVKPFGGGAGATSRKIICASEKYPENDVCVILYQDANGEQRITDNYMGVKYYSETAAVLEEVLKEAFDVDSELFYNVSLSHATEGASDEMTFEEYVAEPSSGISFTAVIDHSYVVDRDAVVARLEQIFREKSICCNFAIIYFNGTEVGLDQINREMLTGYLNKKQYAHRLEFTMDTIDHFSSVKWR